MALRYLASPHRNWFKEQNFTRIHRMIFRRPKNLLENELLQNPNSVFNIDAKGRTALDWATSRAQLEDMRLLIAHNSNPDLINTTGGAIVMHAVESGASPNPRMPDGLLHSSPLTAATWEGMTEMVKLLIHFGAEVNTANPEGRTALQSAAIRQNVECTDTLLENGANMDTPSSNRCTALTTAIVHNSHMALKLFLSKRACPLSDNQVLQVIAAYADLETMSILTSFWSFHLSSTYPPTTYAVLLRRRD